MNTYTVCAWPGAGYFVHPETVTAGSDEEALEIYCRIIIDEGKRDLYLLPEEVTEEDEESGKYIYVDGTMSGAKYPVYLRSENLRISGFVIQTHKQVKTDSALEHPERWRLAQVNAI